MPLFGSKTKHAKDVRQTRSDEANTTRSAVTDQQCANDHAEGHGGGRDSSVQSTGLQAHTDQHTEPLVVGRERRGTGGVTGTLSQSLGQTSPDDMGMKRAQSHSSDQYHQPSGGDGFGSAALREHGLRLEREAESLHQQSAEIAEAERLEQEAGEHRERAVASGADPLYRQPFAGTESSRHQT